MSYESDDDHSDDDDGRTPRNLRTGWVFCYKPAEVFEAAEKKVKHHGERLAWWQQEAAKAELALKEKGFEYRPRRNSLGEDVQIVGDPELARRVTDCKAKVVEHSERQSLFQTWARALKAKVRRQPDEEMKLKINDVVFFGL